ncbi:unnamed protein product [Amaranthus hypochondriacus]
MIRLVEEHARYKKLVS